MSRIKYLRIRFENPIFPYEIPYFRSAVIEKTQRQSDHFHNHKGDEDFLYRYPLIQYKVTDKKASIICLNDGTDEIHHLFAHQNMRLRIGQREENYTIEDIKLHYFQVQTWDTLFHYSLLHWLPLNQKNYVLYKAMDSETEQIALLERILTGNILALGKGIGWHAESRVEVQITAIKSIKLLPFKNQEVEAFSVNFASNVSLPNYIGLGKGSSVGFGVVKGIGNQNKNLNA